MSNNIISHLVKLATMTECRSKGEKIASWKFSALHKHRQKLIEHLSSAAAAAKGLQIAGHRARRTMSRHIAGCRRWTRRARRLLLLIIISGYFCTASYNVVGSLPARPTGVSWPANYYTYFTWIIARIPWKDARTRWYLNRHAHTCVSRTCKRNYVGGSHPRIHV